MKIIVTGCKGQLGTELLKQLQEGRSELGPIPEKLLNATVMPVDLPELDISNYKMVDSSCGATARISSSTAPPTPTWTGAKCTTTMPLRQTPLAPQFGTGCRKDRRTVGARFHRLCVLRPGKRRHSAG